MSRRQCRKRVSTIWWRAACALRCSASSTTIPGCAETVYNAFENCLDIRVFRDSLPLALRIVDALLGGCDDWLRLADELRSQ